MCHVAGMSVGPIAWPAHGSPPDIATSSRLRVISPMGKWNVCVFGRHRSMNAERLTWFCYDALENLASVHPTLPFSVAVSQRLVDALGYLYPLHSLI
jgi:hypothetical protein